MLSLSDCKVEGVGTVGSNSSADSPTLDSKEGL